jgi:hypothetical protein
MKLIFLTNSSMNPQTYNIQGLWFGFTKRFETVSRKSPMKWLAFPKEANVMCRIIFLFKFNKNLQFK